MKQSWKLLLEYDGTRYRGWQEQENARTVMGEVRRAIEDALHARVELQGAGRTDAGVHAAGQVAHLRYERPRPDRPERLLEEFNARLPADIVILEAEPVPARFHARHDATARTYVYQISTRKTAFAKKYVWWVKEKLDIAKMRQAATTLVGRHDFSRFRAKDPSRPEESPIVVVNRVSLDTEDGLLLFRIEASHFIWRMVRRVVGALVKLGKGEIEPRDFEDLVAAAARPDLDVAAWTAPASGLFLEAVTYSGEPVKQPASLPSNSSGSGVRRPARSPSR